MSAEKFDVVIIGGGNAGIGVTGPVRRAGLSVAMIESHDLGGTCPNRGCTTLHDIERAAQHRIAGHCRDRPGRRRARGCRRRRCDPRH
jgi:glutathione reductase (NADPH)